MSLSVSLLKGLNKLFPRREHPFNLQSEGKMTYAEWQYKWGQRTVECFTHKTGLTPEKIFKGKTVLDMGCGASGKSLYYISIGAERVVGVDIVEHYKAEAETYAKKLGFEDRFEFLLGDALHLPMEDGSFDVVIMNDFMEHIYDPVGALQEAMRVLKPGGRIYISLPPYYHPTGAHMFDVIGIPWVHLFFSERTLIAAYKDLVHGLPDEKERLELRFGLDKDGNEAITYLNKMSLRRFRRILKEQNLTPVLYREEPLRPYVAPLAKLPYVKEMFIRMAACVLEKPQ